ncbi:unnamed protein product [Tetraodon nigroviridis]|uniref:(spotted green pufferfish) hypothetical protein n=1 Tax=Tetraodon nigroviridis TaxID=99883 RepID=Q4RQP3_TETNG|nr:unnamed protein product [Tetraodon nigroviridis]
MGSTQMEDTSFGFSGSFFSEKKSADPKASSCPEFVFNQQEQREDFQFDFSSTSPQKDNKDSRFPFSFNF